jgi:hypothetical protein
MIATIPPAVEEPLSFNEAVRDGLHTQPTLSAITTTAPKDIPTLEHMFEQVAWESGGTLTPPLTPTRAAPHPVS